ncbi:TPA: hypothetical protein ACPSKE_002969 [Legionella feeleii]
MTGQWNQPQKGGQPGQNQGGQEKQAPGQTGGTHKGGQQGGQGQKQNPPNQKDR